MFDRVKDIFARIKFSRPVKTDNKDDEANGKIYTLWLLILPLLCGVVLGRLASVYTANMKIGRADAGLNVPEEFLPNMEMLGNFLPLTRIGNRWYLRR